MVIEKLYQVNLLTPAKYLTSSFMSVTCQSKELKWVIKFFKP